MKRFVLLPFLLLLLLIMAAPPAIAGGNVPPSPLVPDGAGGYSLDGSLAIGGAYHSSGNGSPEGVVTAPIGSTYSRLDGGTGTSRYIKEAGTGNTGWVAQVSGSVTGATINDLAGDGDTTEAWSADKIFDQLALHYLKTEIDAITEMEAIWSVNVLTQTEGDARYYTETETGGAVSATDSGAYRTGVFDEFNNSTGTNIQDVLDDLDQAYTDHVSAADPHTGYMLESNIGTGAGNYIVLDGSGRLPAVDGSQLTNLPSGSVEDVAYDVSTWNADSDGASKNVLRDYFYLFDADGDGDFTDETWFPSTSGAPTSATYLTSQAEAGLSDEKVVSANGLSLVTAVDYAAMALLQESALEGVLDLPELQGSLAISQLATSGDYTATGGDWNFEGAGSFKLPVWTSGSNFEGTTVDDYETTLWVIDPTADRAINLPDASGTLLLADGSGASLTSIPLDSDFSSNGLMTRTGAGTYGIATAGSDYVAPGGALGTPTSGNLTNCTFPSTQATDSEVPAISSGMPVPIFTLNVKDPDDAVDDVKKQFPRAMTLARVTGICVGGTNVVGRLYEVDGDGSDADAVGVETSDWTFTTTESEDTSFNNAAIDAGDYLQWDTTSVSGEVSMFTLVVYGYES